MARREVVKTDLGRRLRAVRAHFGDPPREEFARKLEITDKTLANHERGDSQPDASVLGRYRSQLGININWLTTGEGAMFDDLTKAPVRPLDGWTMRRMAAIVTSVYEERKIPIKPENVAVEAADLYNDLMARVADPTDHEEVEATLPQLRLHLKRRLEQAAAEPGSGKRSAS